MAVHGVVRPTASALFLQHFAASQMLWGMAAVPVLVTGLLWLYGAMLDRFGSRGTLAASTVLSLALLLVPAVVHVAVRDSGSGLAGDAAAFFLYVWNDAFVVLLLEQLWALANSTHSVAGGKRNYGFLLVIGGLGATGGNQAVARLAPLVGTLPIYFASLGLLIPFIWLMSRVFRLPGARVSPGGKPTSTSGSAGLTSLAGSGYLGAIAAVVGLGQFMVAPLDVVFQHRVASEFAGLDATSSYTGDFWSVVNGASLGLQFLTPLVLQWVSVSRLHLLVPLTHAACILALLVHPCLATAAIAFGWFKVVDYSVFRAAKEVLYVPLDFDARYRAKMLIDMVIYRTSKGASALALSLASALVQRFMPFLPLVALTAAAAWVPLAAVIGRGFTHAKHP